MSNHVSGFTSATVNFLSELSKNNNRDWFNEHKSDYEKYVKEPSLALIDVMNDRFDDLGVPYISTPKASMFRIYRDTRFSKNKDPYKTNIGLFFPYVRQKSENRPVEAPGIYLHIDANEVFIAGGLYMPLPDQLRAIRERISDESKEFLSIVKKPRFLQEFPAGLTGDTLQRVPRGFAADHPNADLLKMKQYLVSSQVNQEEIFTEQIIDTIEAKSLALAPLLTYFEEAIP